MGSGEFFVPSLVSNFSLYYHPLLSFSLNLPLDNAKKCCNMVSCYICMRRWEENVLFFSLSWGLTQINQKISYFSKKISENARKLGGGFVFSHCYLKYGFYGNPQVILDTMDISVKWPVGSKNHEVKCCYNSLIQNLQVCHYWFFFPCLTIWNLQPLLPKVWLTHGELMAPRRQWHSCTITLWVKQTHKWVNGMVGLDLSRRLGLHTSSLMLKGKSVEPAMYLLLLLATYPLLSHYLPSFLGNLLVIKHQWTGHRVSVPQPIGWWYQGSSDFSLDFVWLGFRQGTHLIVAGHHPLVVGSAPSTHLLWNHEEV